MERRELLKAAGGVGTVGLLGGIYVSTRNGSDAEPADSHENVEGANEVGTGTETAETETEDDETTTEPEDEPESGIPHAEEFETVVKATEHGVDPTGEEPANFLFEEYADDDTLLAFGSGTYMIDFFSLYRIAHLGVVGIDDEPARFVPAPGKCRGGHPWVAFDSISDLLMENVTFDFREADYGGPVHLLLEGDSTVRDVTYRGSCSNQIGTFKVAVQDEGGSAMFERVTSLNDDANNTLTGIFVTAKHAGVLTFADCTLENFSDNGLYASAPGKPEGRDGAVHVVGGTYRNNNIANVRLGSTGATARHLTVVVDSETPGWGGLNARGIRLRNKADQVIENCEITFGPEAADSFGAIVFHSENGGAIARDTAITIDRDSVPAIRAFAVAHEAHSAPRFENLTIRGRAASGVTARIEGRDNTVFEGCTIEQRGENRAGIQFVDSTDCRIVDSRIDVGERPVIARNSRVVIENSTVVTPAGETRIENEVLENDVLSVSSSSS